MGVASTYSLERELVSKKSFVIWNLVEKKSREMPLAMFLWPRSTLDNTSQNTWLKSWELRRQSYKNLDPLPDPPLPTSSTVRSSATAPRLVSNLPSRVFLDAWDKTKKWKDSLSVRLNSSVSRVENRLTFPSIGSNKCSRKSGKCK